MKTSWLTKKCTAGKHPTKLGTSELNIKAATVDRRNKIITSLDAKKATRPDKILDKVVKISQIQPTTT